MSSLPDTAEQQLRKVETSQQFHDSIVDRYKKRFNSFEGRMSKMADSAQWQSQLHPPYLNHIVETSISTLVDDSLAYKVTPKPRLWDAPSWEKALLGAKAHEALHRQQMARDRFNEQQRPIALIAAVNGWSIAKTFWRNEVAPKKRLEMVETLHPDLVAMGHSLPKLVTKESKETVFDGPVTECVDPRDFYWEEAASNLDKASWVAHAVWLTLDDIKELGKRGVYDQKAVDELQKPSDPPGKATDVEQEREKRSREKGRIEVLEIWDRQKQKVTTIGGRNVVLRERDWPFWHRQYPFVVFSTQPFPFSLQGMSVVDKLMHLQDAAWDLMNQRIDNTRFLNNAIAIIRADVDDPDLPYEPGAQWFLEDPTQVQMWSPNPLAAQLSVPAESMLKADMQNLAGGHPFTSTSEASDGGQAGTATEAALVSNIAQGMERRAKMEMYYSYQRVGQQRTELNQQFIREPVYTAVLGNDNAQLIHEILPEILQGEFLFDIAPMAESLMRSERRAEQSGLFQTSVAAAPVMAQSGSPINLKAVYEDLLDTYDKQDKERYFAAKPQPQVAQGGQPQQQGDPSQPQGPGGVTAPQATNADTSPSHQASISPEVFMQRQGAANGGVHNT